MSAPKRLLEAGPGDVLAAVKQKIDVALLEIISDEEWAQLIARQFEKFKTEKLPALVNTELEKFLRPRLEEWIKNCLWSDYDWEERFDGILEIVVREGTQAWFKMLMQGALRSMQNPYNRVCGQCGFVLPANSTEHNCPRCNNWMGA